MENDWKKIIHIDMDCFYAAVEMRDNPALQGHPIAVGHDGPRGVVATANYEARRYGVHSAMPIGCAQRLCKHLIIVPPRFDVYKLVSNKIHTIFHKYTDVIEPLSLDEAYLDVTQNKVNEKYAVDIAQAIKRDIFTQTSLTASAGVSYCKFLAKIASDWRKPNGLYIIHPANALEFIKSVPIEKFWGVGPVTAAKMHSLGVTDGATLAKVPLHILREIFGKAGRTFYDFARGIDNRIVESNQIRKSVSCEETLNEDTADKSDMKELIEVLATDLENRIEKKGFSGRTFVLKVKYDNHKIHTRSYTFNAPISTHSEFITAAVMLLDKAVPDGQAIRLIGIGVTDNLSHSRYDYDNMRPTLDFGEY